MCTGPQLRVTESSYFEVLLPHLSQQAATVPFQLVYPQAKGSGGGQNHQTCTNLAHALLLLLVAVASQSNQPGSPRRCLLLG